MSDSEYIADEVTTAAKVIPALVSRRLSGDVELAEAFRKTVAGFDGSVAIAVPDHREARNVRSSSCTSTWP